MLTFLIPWTGISVLVFLVLSGFLSSWDGHAISVRPPRAGQLEPPTWRVLILEADGWQEQDWPADAVEGLDLPYDATGVPPTQVPEDRPATKKSRFQLHFIVEAPQGGWRTVGTTSPRSLGLSVVIFLLGIGVRNMVYAGSPLSLSAREVYLPPGQTPAGSTAPTTRPSRSRKGPPPPKRRRGRGR